VDEHAIIEASAAGRQALIAASYHRLTGEVLAQDLWTAPVAVVAHGTEASPRFFYANRLALDLFRMRADQFIGMESRFSAGPADRDERAAMLAGLNAANVVRGYRGVRVAGDGTRFTIDNAVIWNLLDERGTHQGQAAAFGTWHSLD
jgi:hypothetical protein